MTPTSSTTSFLHVLSGIANAARSRKLAEQCLLHPPSTTPNSAPSPCIPIPALDLPYPIDMPSFLDSLKLSDSVTMALSLKVQDWVSRIQRLHQEKFEDTCRQLLAIPETTGSTSRSLPIEGIREAFQYAYMNRYLPSIKERILHLHSRLPQSCATEKKVPFKNEHRPLLEKYFQHNAYPSAQERLALARKTGMTARQIEVWFQNHRNRAKKDGKQLAKRNGLPARFEEWDFSVECDASLDAESDNDYSDRDSVASGNILSAMPEHRPICPFPSIAPPHAFPSKYPLDDSVDPFPNKNGIFTFPAIDWPRRPSPVPIPRRSLKATDMDELSGMFSSKLNLRENTSKGHKYSKNRSSTCHLPWFSSTTTTPCSAPHPSLIRNPMPRHSVCTSKMQSRTKPTPGQRLPSVGASSSFPRDAVRPTKQQKTSSLVKRLPTDFPTTYMQFSAMSNEDRHSSGASSRSRLSSSSSLSSLDLPTPSSSLPASPVAQPEVALSRDDYHTYDHLFGTGATNPVKELVPTILPSENPYFKDYASVSPPYDLSMLFEHSVFGDTLTHS